MKTESDGVQPRIIGDAQGSPDGPLLLCVAGIHGNEPAGITALSQVFDALTERNIELNGRLVGLRGNLRALARNVRFIDIDLNRAWTSARLQAIRRGEPAADSEAHEQRELLSIMDPLLSDHEGRAHCVDLHTTSGSGAPFATLGDTLKNRDFALGVPATKVLGIEEQIDGALLEYLNNEGHVTLGFEAGRHDDPKSVERHRAFIWLSLASAKIVRPDQVPELDVQKARIEEMSNGSPPFVEIRHRHQVRPGDGFRMAEGWSHFQPVEKGAILAHDAEGPIAAPEDGILLLPLYQGQGDDGFFIGRPVNPLWLGVSRAVRRAGLPALAHWLPGVRRKKGDPRTVLVNARVARWQSGGVFHLLGFRRVRADGPYHAFSRRPE